MTPPWRRKGFEADLALCLAVVRQKICCRTRTCCSSWTVRQTMCCLSLMLLSLVSSIKTSLCADAPPQYRLKCDPLMSDSNPSQQRFARRNAPGPQLARRVSKLQNLKHQKLDSVLEPQSSSRTAMLQTLGGRTSFPLLTAQSCSVLDRHACTRGSG